MHLSRRLHFIIKTVGLSVFCAAVSIVLCMAMRKAHAFMAKAFKNGFVRIAAGGFVIAILTFLVQNRDYNGAGMDIITKSIGGSSKPEAFLLKIIFTAITIGAAIGLVASFCGVVNTLSAR